MWDVNCGNSNLNENIIDAVVIAIKAIANYRKSSLINSPGGLIYFKHVWGGGGLIQTGGLFNLAKMVVSALHKKTRMQIGKLKYKKLEVVQPRVKNKSELPTRE